MENKTKDEWLDIIFNALRNFKHKQTIEFGRVETTGFSEFYFIKDILSAFDLMDEIGCSELVKRMNENIPKNFSAEEITKKWNASKSPIRNFLIVRHIDYPTKVEIEHRNSQ